MCFWATGWVVSRQYIACFLQETTLIPGQIRPFPKACSSIFNLQSTALEDSAAGIESLIHWSFASSAQACGRRRPLPQNISKSIITGVKISENGRSYRHFDGFPRVCRPHYFVCEANIPLSYLRTENEIW